MHMAEGEITADGTAEEILQNSELLDRCGLKVSLLLKNCPVCGASKE